MANENVGLMKAGITPVDLPEALVILNEARVNEGYQDEPEITAENLKDMGVLPANQLNKYVNGINLILELRTFRNVFDSSKNPFRRFVRDMSQNGFGMQDIMIEFIDGVTPMWDSSNTDEAVLKDLVSYAEDKLLRKFHQDRMEQQFKASIDERDYSKMFTASQLPSFINGKIANLAASAEYWLLNQLTDLIRTMVNEDKMIASSVAHDLSNVEGIKSCVEELRVVTEGMCLPCNLYNKEHIVTLSNGKDDLFIFTTPEIIERIKVQDLSGAYNLDMANLPGNLLLLPNGTDLGTVAQTGKKALFVVVDRKTLVLGIRTWRMTNFLIPNTLKHNNWLSVEGLKSYNTFSNTYVISGDLNADVASDTANFNLTIDGLPAPVDGCIVTFGNGGGGDSYLFDKNDTINGLSLDCVNGFITVDCGSTKTATISEPTIGFTKTVPSSENVFCDFLSIPGIVKDGTYNFTITFSDVTRNAAKTTKNK